MDKKRQIKLVLNEMNPNHEIIIDWFDSLNSDGRGRQTAIHLENAMLEYISHLNESRSTRTKSERNQSGSVPVRKPNKTKERAERVTSAKPVSVDVVYEENQPKRQSGEISSATLRLINNSDFD